MDIVNFHGADARFGVGKVKLETLKSQVKEFVVVSSIAQIIVFEVTLARLEDREFRRIPDSLHIYLDKNNSRLNSLAGPATAK
jgi:hypothetical protein